MPYQNFYATRLANDIGATDTTIPVETVPSVTAGRLVLEARNATQREIIKYTGVSGNNLTGVTRGDGGTTAKSHVKNALVEMNATAADLQDVIDAFGTFAASANDWRTALTTVTAVTYNGNRSYDLTVNADMTALITPGMRISTTRTVAAPTQSTSLNGTTQYFNRSATINGMTFTNNFVVSAWVKLSSYALGSIVSRYNGTSGWDLHINANGTISMNTYNAGGANFKSNTSYQSIPLNKWVHIAAQVDMTVGNPGTTTTNYIMLDGVDIPLLVTSGGTVPTSLVQAGNLEIGSTNGGTQPFPGKIAQVAIYSAKVTQANIRATISQGLLGTETSLISAYSFNNSINDLVAGNANNLTPNGSAVATNADSPFGGQANGTISSTLDYGIVQKITASTITVQVPEGCTIPATGGVSSLRYSGARSPFGFPGQRGKWTVDFISRNAANATVSATYLNITGLSLIAPLGEWKLSFEGVLFNNSASLPSGASLTVSDANNTANPAILDNMFGYMDKVAALYVPFRRENPRVSLPAATTLYINGKYFNSNSSNYGLDGGLMPTIVSLENAYL